MLLKHGFKINNTASILAYSSSKTTKGEAREKVREGVIGSHIFRYLRRDAHRPHPYDYITATATDAILKAFNVHLYTEIVLDGGRKLGPTTQQKRQRRMLMNPTSDEKYAYLQCRYASWDQSNS